MRLPPRGTSDGDGRRSGPKRRYVGNAALVRRRRAYSQCLTASRAGREQRRNDAALPVEVRATRPRLIGNPEDRRQAAQTYIESVGGKLHGFWYAFGRHDGYTLCEAPDNVSMAAVALAISEGGAPSSLETTVLLTVDETMDALCTAERVQYRAPGARPRWTAGIGPSTRGPGCNALSLRTTPPRRVERLRAGARTCRPRRQRAAAASVSVP